MRASSASRTSDIPPRPKVCVKRIVAAGTRTGRRWRTNVPTTVRARSASVVGRSRQEGAPRRAPESPSRRASPLDSGSRTAVPHVRATIAQERRRTRPCQGDLAPGRRRAQDGRSACTCSRGSSRRAARPGPPAEGLGATEGRRFRRPRRPSLGGTRISRMYLPSGEQRDGHRGRCRRPGARAHGAFEPASRGRRNGAPERARKDARASVAGAMASPSAAILPESHAAAPFL